MAVASKASARGGLARRDDVGARMAQQASEAPRALQGRSSIAARRLLSRRRALDRFGGYDVRFSKVVDRVRGGDPSWVDRTGVDSCHTVWFELHEDLVATLGITR